MTAASLKKGFTLPVLLGGLLLFISSSRPVFSAETTPQELIPFLVLASLAVCLITLVNTNFGLSVLIFSMLLSPEIEAFKTPRQAVVVRIDDFLIGAVFLTWMAKMAIFKGAALFRATPLNRPMISYLAICLFSTLIAMLNKSISGPAPFFFLLKYLEYYLLFFMFLNNVQTRKQIQNFLTCLMITGVIVCIYALSLYGIMERLTGPFEGGNPQPASLGGFLLVLISCLLGFLGYPTWPKHRFLILVPLGLALTTLWLSLSRGALTGFIALYLVAILLPSRGRIGLVFLLVLVIILGAAFTPARIFDFLRATFIETPAGGGVFQVGGLEVELGPSPAGRVMQYQWVLQEWMKNPLIGYGVTGVGLVDSQYLLVVGETGFIGSCIFLWLLVRIFQAGISAFREGQDPFAKALGMAFLLASTGIVVQGLTANSFIIVRIMEPFWFLAAMTVGVMQLQEEAPATARDASPAVR